DVVAGLLPDLRRRYALDLVVCNAENSAGGFGLTQDSGRGLLEAGVDGLTRGNHLLGRKEARGHLAGGTRPPGPPELPEGTPGRGWGLFATPGGNAVGVVNLLGRVYMKEADSPFRAADRAIEELRAQTKVILVDIHAETTAEKIALGWYLDGRASVVVG